MATSLARMKVNSKRHYQSNKAAYKERKIRWRTKQRALLYEYILAYLKEHPCVDCGEADPIVLEFDHRGGKTMALTDMARQCKSLVAVITEIEKCDVRCANCHRRKTYRERNLKHRG